jgi:SAM-dependent methyltransferase
MSTNVLPDVSGLANVDQAFWSGFGVHLDEIGVTAKYVTMLRPPGLRASDSIVRPIMLAQLRERGDPAAIIIRLLVMADEVEEQHATDAFGNTFFDRFLQAGLLCTSSKGKILTPFRLSFLDDIAVLHDELLHGGDAVFGVGPGSRAFLGLATPGVTVNRAVDIGCGAGAVALWISRFANHVVATDINPRALIFFHLNAALNRIENTETRLGDGFTPIQTEQFDLVLSQPPYVPSVDSSRSATYREAGPRGTEISSKFIKEAPNILRAAGRAMIVLELPITDPPSCLPESRASKCRTILIRGQPVESGAYSMRYASALLREGIRKFDAAASAMYAHLDASGVFAVQPAVCIIEKGRKASVQKLTLNVDSAVWDQLDVGSIDLLLRRLDIIEAQKDTPVRMNFSHGSQALLVTSLTSSDVSEVKVILPQPSLFSTVSFTSRQWQVLASLLPTFEVAYRNFQGSRELHVNGRIADAHMLKAVRKAIRTGLVTPSDTGSKVTNLA